MSAIAVDSTQHNGAVTVSEPDPDRPRTIDVDAEISRLTTKSGIVVVGVVSVGAGLLLRVFARMLAWPKGEANHSSDSIFTGTFAEKLYIDLGMVLLVFGLALLFLSMARAHRSM